MPPVALLTADIIPLGMSAVCSQLKSLMITEITMAPQNQFLRYIRTKMYFSLRLRSPTDEMQPVHISSKEIDERFFPFPKFNRKDEMQKLVKDGQLQITTKKSFSKDGKEYSKYYYMALKPGGFDLNLMDTKNIPDDAVTQTMLKNIQLVTLPDDAPSTDYMSLFLKYQQTHHRVFFTVDKFAGRVHTPISNFHRTHRPNLLIEGKETTSLDVATMQPLLLGRVLFNAIGANDFSTWINEGKDIYLMLQGKANLSTRDEAKKKFFEILFNKPDKSLEELFGAANWITWINQYKSIEIKENPNLKFNKDGSRSFHNNLAWRLQSDEVVIMRKIWSVLVDLQIPFLSVHDELIVKKDDAVKTYEIMYTVLSKEFAFFKVSRETEPQANDNTASDAMLVNPKEQLKTLLNELIQKVPANESFAINGHEGECFNQYVQSASSSLINEFNNPNTRKQIANIYQLMELNNHTQFINKY